MANRSHRLARFREALHEFDRPRIHPQLVGIHYPTRQQQSIEILGIRGIKRNVDRDFLAPVFMIPSFHFRARRRNDQCGRARVVQRLSRFQQLRLLKPICYKNCHSFP